MNNSKRPRLKQAQSVNTLLKEMLTKPGFGEQITRHQAWLVWDKIVGNQIAARARPLRLRKGVLEIAVDHPVWMQQLQMMKTQILTKIQEQVPKAGITDLYLRNVGHSATPAPAKTARQSSPPLEDIKLSNAERSHIDHLVKQIENPELQQELRRFFCLQAKLQIKRDS
jgi:predicted nucleic acid-binding Zn ribbon protein